MANSENCKNFDKILKATTLGHTRPYELVFSANAEVKGCVRYVFASLLFKSKRKRL